MKRNFLYSVSVLSLLQIYFALDIVNAIKSHKPFSRNEVGADATPTIGDLTPGPCLIEVTWTCPSCPATFDGFKVYWQQTGKDSQSEQVSSQTNSYYIDGLISSQSYTVWVASIIDGVETASSKEQISTLEGVPYEVTGVQSETLSDSVIKVSWDKTSNPCPIQGYYVTWNGTSKWDERQKLNGYLETYENTTSIDVENLMAYSVYDFFVSEITTDGIIGDPSYPSSADTEEGAASAPTAVTSLTLSSSSIQVNWSLPEALNGVLTGYHITCQLLPETDDHCDITTEVDVFTATPDTLLECGDYTISVQAINGYGLGEAAPTTSTTDAEEPPNFTDLIFNNITSTSVNITWTPLDTNCPVTKYNLHGDETVSWKYTTDSFDRTIPVEDEYIILEYLTPYSNYNMSIKATTAGGTTDYFTNDFDTLEDVAEAPEQIISTTLDSSSVSVSWIPSTAINGQLQGYHITCSKKKIDLINDCDILTDKTTYAITGLDACSNYTIQVRAVNGVGDGEAAITECPTDSERPPNITNFQAFNVTSTTASLYWDSLITTCPILEYTLQLEEIVLWNNETSAYKVSFLVEDNFYLLEDLFPSSKYSLNFSAINEGGRSYPAYTEFQTLEEELDDDAPVIEELTALSPCSIVVIWKCDEVCLEGLINYNVYWHQTGSRETLEVTEGYHTNYYEIQGLISSTSYTVWVSSVKNDGEHNSSSTKTSTYIGVPYEVTDVQAETVSDSVIEVSWEKTSNPCQIQGYYVTWSGTAIWDESQSIIGSHDTEENTTSIEVDNLMPYSEYDFFVSEVTTDGIIGDPSDPASVATQEGAAGAPTSVTSLTLSSSSIQVNWTEPEKLNGVLTGYHISCQLLPETEDYCNLGIDDIDIFTATPEALLECGDYTISVQAVNGYGLGEPGQTISTTEPEEPPNFTEFYVSNITSTSAVLTWLPLDTNCPVLYYILEGEGFVLWSGDTDPISLVLNVENNYYSLDHLIPWTMYNLTIHATTEGGTSDSTYVEFETLEGAADAPADLTITSIGSTTTTLSWRESPAINGELQGYHISCSKKRRVNLNDDCNIIVNKLTYTATGLDACSNYTFEVSAVNGFGNGEAATIKSATETENPGDMGEVQISEIYSTNTTITIEPLATSCDILHYDVFGLGVARWDENLTMEYQTTLEDGEETYVLQNLNPYTSYTFNMSATTAGGTTNGVIFEGSTTRDVPSKPTNFKANVLDSSRVRLTWDEPEFQNGINLQNYYLSYELLGVESDEIDMGNIIKTYTLGDHDSETLLPCQSYNIKLRASNEMGIGPAATVRATLDAVVPNAVELLTCNPVGPYTVELTWEVQSTSCRIEYYQITLKGDILWDGTTNSSLNVSNIPSNEGSVTLDDLTAYTMYNITLEAGNDAGLGSATSCSCETETDVPSSPTNLALVIGTLTESGFSVTWDDPTFENGIMERFIIYLWYGGIIIDENIVEYSDDSSYYYSFTQLNSGTFYIVSVAAENNAGIGSTTELQIITL